MSPHFIENIRILKIFFQEIFVNPGGTYATKLEVYKASEEEDKKDNWIKRPIYIAWTLNEYFNQPLTIDEDVLTCSPDLWLQLVLMDLTQSER